MFNYFDNRASTSCQPCLTQIMIPNIAIVLAIFRNILMIHFYRKANLPNDQQKCFVGAL